MNDFGVELYPGLLPEDDCRRILQGFSREKSRERATAPEGWPRGGLIVDSRAYQFSYKSPFARHTVEAIGAFFGEKKPPCEWWIQRYWHHALHYHVDDHAERQVLVCLQGGRGDLRVKLATETMLYQSDCHKVAALPPEARVLHLSAGDAVYMNGVGRNFVHGSPLLTGGRTTLLLRWLRYE